MRVASAAFCIGLALSALRQASTSSVSHCEDEYCEDEDLLLKSSTNLLQVSMSSFKSTNTPPQKSEASAAVPQHPAARLPGAKSAAATLGAAFEVLPQTTAERWHAILLAFLSACVTLGMLVAYVRSDSKGKGQSIFKLVARREPSPEELARQMRMKLSTPPWEKADAQIVQGKYARKSKKAMPKDAEASGKDDASVPDESFEILPTLNPSIDCAATLAEECFIISMEALVNLRKTPVNITDVSGEKLLQAAVVTASDGEQSLQISLVGSTDGPHATVNGVGGANLTMRVFGQGSDQPYGHIEPQVGGGSRLMRDGRLALLLQAGFPADLRIMALNAEGDFLASGGRYLGVRRSPDEVWKLRVCSRVDPLLVVACMLATILEPMAVLQSGATQTPEQVRMLSPKTTMCEEAEERLIEEIDKGAETTTIADLPTVDA
jgi:hypothetical protein